MRITNQRNSALAGETYTLAKTLDSYEVEEVNAHDLARLFPDVALQPAEFLLSTGSPKHGGVCWDSRNARSAPSARRPWRQSGSQDALQTFEFLAGVLAQSAH